MASDILTYDDRNLQALFAALSEKQRASALRGAFRREAGRVRKAAIGNLRQNLHSSRDLEKGVRAIVFKRQAGFRITVGTSGRKSRRTGAVQTFGYHRNRFGLEKPVLIWAEDGTAYRRTKKGAARGRMRRYGFMARTQSEVTSTVTSELHDEIRAYVFKQAKKYGCTV